MWRNILKWATSAAAFILVLVGGAILSQGLDGLAEAAGVKTIAGALFRYMAGLGVGSWFLFAGAFLGGVAICLHGERLLRILHDRRTAQDCAHMLFEFDDEGRARTYSDKSGTIFGMVIDGQMHGRLHESEPKASRLVCTVLVVFERSLRDPVAFVAADRVVIWREVSNSDRHIAIEIDPRAKGKATIKVIVRPERWADWGRFIPTPMQWQDATVVSTDQISQGIVPPRMSDWLFRRE
jgi:hypothetical protein